MNLFKKSDIGDTYQHAGELPLRDTELLKEWWRDKEISEAKKRAVGEVLRKIHDQNLWIGCDCLDQDGIAAQHPPLFYPFNKENTYSVRRGTKRSNHAERCVFHWKQGELQQRLEKEGGSSIQTDGGPTRDFLLFKRRDQAVASAGGAGPQTRGNDGPTMNSLQRIMFSLIDMAGVNRFDIADHPDSDTKRIRVAAERYTLFDGANLSDILWAKSDWYSKGWALNALKRLQKDSAWPGNVPMQGYFMFSALKIDGKTIQISKTESLEIESPVVVHGGQDVARGPYSVLIASVMDEKTNELRLVRAYAHPRYIDKQYQWSYCPVDSDYERKALGAILWAIRKLAERGGKLKDIELEKPLFNIEGCLPDFIINVGDKRFIIETMGSDDAEYLLRKGRTHPIMEQLGPIILDNRANVDPESANRKLISSIIREVGAA